MNSYELSRAFFDYAFNNPEKIKPNHVDIYFFAIEHCNRLGWKEKFGFPSQMVMEAVGIKNWRTYSKTLSELVEFGFIKMIEISKNQYSSNIIAIVKNTKAHTKALDKALQKHGTKHGTKQGQSIVSIDKQYNNITSNNITPTAKEKSFKSLSEIEFKNSLIPFVDNFGKKTVREFFDYWSEKSASGQMRFQMNKTWDSKKRLTTWKANEPKFGNSTDKQKVKTSPAGVWNV
jgi:hypothetical protein